MITREHIELIIRAAKPSELHRSLESFIVKLPDEPLEALRLNILEKPIKIYCFGCNSYVGEVIDPTVYVLQCCHCKLTEEKHSLIDSFFICRELLKGKYSYPFTCALFHWTSQLINDKRLDFAEWKRRLTPLAQADSLDELFGE